MKLFLLLEERVVLRQTLQRQFVSDLDVLRVWHISLLERADFDWIGCAEEANLTVSRAHFQDLLDDLLELTRDQSVHLIQDANLALVKAGLTSRGQVKDTTRRGDDNVHRLAHSDNILVDARATR